MSLATEVLKNIPSWVRHLPAWAQAGGGAAFLGAAGGWAGTRSAAVAATMAGGSGLTIGGTVGAFQALGATGYGQYKAPGWLAAFGFDPTETLGPSAGNLAGGTRFKGYWGWDLDYKDSSNWGVTQRPLLQKWNSIAGAKERLPGNWLGVAGTAYSLYSGYQEGGIGGAYDAMALNVGVEAALFKWNTGVGLAQRVGDGNLMHPSTKLAGHPLQTSMGSTLRRGIGASVGGYIGQQLGLATGIPMAGTIGATAGAYVGAAPIRAAMANPILVGGMMAAVGAGAVSYGAYSVIKTAGQMGYAHRQSMRGINTDGSMASFMTQNALTMRERSVQAINRSHLNARSALGSEANFLHSPKNYNSRYR